MTSDGYVPGWQRRVVRRSLGRAADQVLDTATRFLDAAVEIMQRGDGEDFTVQQVAETAGLSLRSFYQHFQNKDDLVVAAFEVAIEVHERLLREAVERHSDPFDRLLAGMWSLSHLSRKGSPEVVAGLTRFRLRLLQSNPDRVLTANSRIISFLQTLVEDAIVDRKDLRVDPTAVAFSMFSVSQAVTLDFVLGATTGLPDDEWFLTFFVRGLGRSLPSDWRERVLS